MIFKDVELCVEMPHSGADSGNYHAQNHSECRFQGSFSLKFREWHELKGFQRYFHGCGNLIEFFLFYKIDKCYIHLNVQAAYYTERNFTWTFWVLLFITVRAETAALWMTTHQESSKINNVNIHSPTLRFAKLIKPPHPQILLSSSDPKLHHFKIIWH